jgi:hypothetical protein
VDKTTNITNEGWKLFSIWYFKTFSIQPKDRVVTFKGISMICLYSIMIRTLYEKLDNRFEAYLDYVFNAWRTCKTTVGVGLFPNWLASPKMIKRFEQDNPEGMKIQDGDIERPHADTYSNHKDVGDADDDDFPTHGMW